MKLKRETKIGFFAVAMLLLLYWGFNFLKGRDIFSRTNTYYATYEQINGIQKSAPIVIKGFRVGTISNMSYDPTTSNGEIILRFDIKSKYRIPRNSTARIYSSDLLGGKAVEIELGNASEYLSDGDTLRSEMDRDIIERAGSEFEQMKEKLNVLFGQLTTTLNSVNQLLGEDNQRSLHNSLVNIEGITRKIDHADIETLVANLNNFSMTLRRNTPRIDHIMQNVDNFSDSLSRSQIPTLIAETSRTMAQLNETLAKINTGDGTVGKFVSDRELYDNLVKTTDNMQLLLKDLQENPKRYVHFSLFGRSDKAEKSKK